MSLLLCSMQRFLQNPMPQLGASSATKLALSRHLLPFATYGNPILSNVSNHLRMVAAESSVLPSSKIETSIGPLYVCAHTSSRLRRAIAKRCARAK